jgi:hypothetical protein
VTTNPPPNQRVYFIDGPAAGTSIRTARSTPRLSWADANGTAHGYRRVTNLRGTHFYRRGR